MTSLTPRALRDTLAARAFGDRLLSQPRRPRRRQLHHRLRRRRGRLPLASGHFAGARLRRSFDVVHRRPRPEPGSRGDGSSRGHVEARGCFIPGWWQVSGPWSAGIFRFSRWRLPREPQ